MAVFPTVYIESTWTPCGVHMESRETFQNIVDSNSVETPCGLSVDSMRADSLIYLIKKNFNHI